MGIRKMRHTGGEKNRSTGMQGMLSLAFDGDNEGYLLAFVGARLSFREDRVPRHRLRWPPYRSDRAVV